MVVRYSHPPENGRDGVLLRNHLADVAERVEHVGLHDATTPDGSPVRDVVETLAWVHDLGKATTYFQQYIGVEDGSPPLDMLRHHSPLGAFAAYFALDARGFETETCLAGFVAIGKHHGQLPNVAKYVYDRTYRRNDIPAGEQNTAEKRQTAVVKQIKDISDEAPGLADEIINNATAGEADWSSFSGGFVDRLDEISRAVSSSGLGPAADPMNLSKESYALVLQCWSALVLADKTSAAGAPAGAGVYDAKSPSASRLDEHVREIEAAVNADPDGNESERLNHYRSRARESVVSNAATFADEGGGVATLTLPTGMGKTLTGLSGAFEIRDRLDGERVVYALPFTSVIDQVVDELETIYETDTSGRLLTAHHHLTETTIQDDSNDASYEEADLSDDVAGMLGESWRAGLTVTTFVQLFESLAGPKNTQSMKLPALYDSVVILDEPQSLPLTWWKLVPRLVRVLTEQYGATVVAMTATQPRLFESAEDLEGPTELVDEPETYFEAVERVEYELDPSTERYITDQTDPKSYDDAAGRLRDTVSESRSVLAVCNTIDSARKLTNSLTSQGGPFVDVASVYETILKARDDADTIDADTVAERVVTKNEEWAILHLSTRLRPVDRLTLIETAKRLTDTEVPLAVVSTQLVEAGVDISFDSVYRDLAPVDSIVQAAGRCNRSFERDRGRVVVWWLDAPQDQNKTPSEAVYNRGPSLLPVAADTLRSVRQADGTIAEEDVARTAVERYYVRLREDKDVGKQAYADYVDEAAGDDLAELSLIDERLSADVVVCRTDDDRALVSELRSAKEAYDFDRIDTLLDRTKPLRISVPYYREDSETAEAITQLPTLVADRGLYELDVDERPDHFDSRTGFVVPNSSVEHQFL
jgi:CRISPR-associated endonuclease Cas3-HD